VTGKSIFNKAAWKTADNILKEILLGYHSDPPDMSFYRYQLTVSGDIKRDHLGIALLECDRGTSGVENDHKHIASTYGKWPMGFAMGDCVLTEHRHRKNHKASQKRRPGFPVLGHFDTWLIDAMQFIYEENHNVLIYPGHSNTSAFVPTAETFGIVPIAPPEIRDAINRLQMPAKFRLPPDLKHVADKTGVKVPTLPWYGKKEWMPYSTLEMSLQGKETENTLD
jgi:hypothetical protein